MRYTINLATRSCLDHRLLNSYALLIISTLIALMAWNVSQYSSVLGEISLLEGDTAAFQRKALLQDRSVPDADLQQMKGHVRFYNEIIGRKSTNWLSLLEILEKVTPVSIAITAIAPGKSGENWKIDGEARNFRAVQMLFEKLGATSGVSDVLLLSHQNVTFNSGSRILQFSLSCKVALK